MKRKEFIIAIPFFMLTLSVQALVSEPKVTELIQKDEISTPYTRKQTSHISEEKIGAANIIKAGVPHGSNKSLVIQKALKEAGLTDKKVTVKELQDDPNTIILIYGEQDITNIRAHSVDADSMGKCEWDFEAYHKTYGMDTYELLADKLEAQKVLAILCIEPEGIPLNYLTWETMPHEQELWVIQYNGK
ncbi:MAG: hypothetical protein K0S71_2897 [Clostridia bacterium]|jgi:hypothetical protein|nr:hypothetical protein [Clostridia bacterium]